MEEEKFINYSVLWNRIVFYSRKAGRKCSRALLLLFFVLRSKETPRKDKMLIISALSYLVLPIDILNAHRLPVIGWIDEMASLSVAIQKVSKYVTPEMEERAEIILARWFPANGVMSGVVP